MPITQDTRAVTSPTPAHPRQHLIGFTLHNMQGEAILVLSKDSQGQVLHLTLVNRSHDDLLLPEGSTFHLMFRNRVLADGAVIEWEPKDGWAWDDGVLKVSSAGGVRLAKDDHLRFKLRKVKLSETLIAHSTRVELKYDLTDDKKGFCEQHLMIVHHLGQKVMPVHVGVVGSRTVLNTGSTDTKNQIRVRITNIGKEPLGFLPESRFMLYFDVDETADHSKAWALGTPSQVAKVTIQFAGKSSDPRLWKRKGDRVEGSLSPWPGSTIELDATVGTQGSVPVWTIIPYPGGGSLAVGAYLDFVLGNFTTKHPPGETNLYISYEDIPGYWDSRLTVAIEKAPLLLVGDSLFVESLDVHGQITVQGKSILPRGMIMMFHGDQAPAGWAICDGKSGTPDLRDRFVAGAGGSFRRNDIGGESKHTLTTDEMPSHAHTYGYAAGDVIALMGAGQRLRTMGVNDGNTTTAAGGGKAHNNMPPYYALYYIMKL